MSITLNPGRVLLDEPAESYYRRELAMANYTGLKLISRKSPAHFKHWVEDPDADVVTPALAFGKALHCAILEPEVFARSYCILPADAPDRPTQAMLNAIKRSGSSQARIDWWSDWNAIHGAKTVLSAADYDRVQGMAESVRRHPMVGPALASAKREVTLRWSETVTLEDGTEVEVPCKARIDVWDDELMFFADPKSCESAHPHDFANAVAGYGYHIQHWHYGRGAEACGIPLKAFLFLAIESKAPYVCAAWPIDPAAEELGEKKRDAAMHTLARCLHTGQWPGYSDTLTPLSLPGWAFYD